MSTPTVIIDNGASRIKYGLDNYESPKSMPNNTAHVKKQMLSYVGDQLDSTINGSLLQYNRYLMKVFTANLTIL